MNVHETSHGVYFDDLDAFRILHNARYLLLFEHAIGDFWRHLGWAGELDFNSNPDQFHLVRANYIEYIRPVVGTGQVRIRLWVEHLGRTSLTFGLSILAMNDELEYAKGTRVIVRVHPQTHTPEPWSKSFRQTIAPYCKNQAK